MPEYVGRVLRERLEHVEFIILFSAHLSGAILSTHTRGAGSCGDEARQISVEICKSAKSASRPRSHAPSLGSTLEGRSGCMIRVRRAGSAYSQRMRSRAAL